MLSNKSGNDCRATTCASVSRELSYTCWRKKAKKKKKKKKDR